MLTDRKNLKSIVKKWYRSNYSGNAERLNLCCCRLDGEDDFLFVFCCDVFPFYDVLMFPNFKNARR